MFYSFIGSVNRVMANFGHLQSHILSQFFKRHCCNFYGSALWYFNSEGFAKMCTTWNKSVRTILKLPIRGHTYLLGPLLNQQNNHVMLEVFVFYTLCIIHLIILSELYSIMPYIVQIRVLVILIFFHALKLLAHIIILPIVQLLTMY